MAESEERPLLPKLGSVEGVARAVALIRLSAGVGDTDLADLEELGEDVQSLIAALSNIAAYLARGLVVLRDGSRDQVGPLLAALRDDQYVRAAREVLDCLDEGLPWP